MQLRQLEEAMGVPLLEQVGRRIRLTEAGRDLERIGAGTAAQIKELEDVMASHRGLQRGRIQLGIVSMAKYFVPMLLVRFRKKFPAVEVELKINNRESILNLFVRNEIDLVIMGRAPDDIECVATPFATNPMGVVGAPERPLSRRRQATLSILKGQEFVVREPGVRHTRGHGALVR